MNFRAERVRQINCGKCGQAIDPSTVKPLASIDCPKCGNHFTVPASFGDFLLVDVLGHGAAGIVCKGFDERLHRQVAIKILRSDVGDEQIVKACQHEARALASLNHPHVVQVHSIGDYRNQPYIVMELLDGGSVEKTMLGQPADEQRAVDIAIHAAEGLQAAQRVGLVHMDVKPGNILFDRQGTAKLIDFGVARFGKTSSNQIVGTPYYVAPEVVRGSKATHQADIYSLGATLYHLLADSPPFTGAKVTDVITARLKRPAPSLDEMRPDLSPTTVRTVARMLEADPADRYQDYDELLADLRLPSESPVVDLARQIPRQPKHARTATVRARTISGKSKKSSNTTLIISAVMIAVMLLIVIAIAVLAYNRSRQNESTSSLPWRDAVTARQVTASVPDPSESDAHVSDPVQLFFNAGGPNGLWAQNDWTAAPRYTSGQSGYDLALGGRRFEAASVDNPVTDTCLLNIEAFRVAVPNGRYRVTLVFAELTKSTRAGERRFSVWAEGRSPQAFAGIDPFADAGGRRIAITREAIVEVRDDMLDLEFKRDIDDSTPILNAVSIARLR